MRYVALLGSAVSLALGAALIVPAQASQPYIEGSCFQNSSDASAASNWEISGGPFSRKTLAQINDISLQSLNRVLDTDKTANIDECGVIYFEEPIDRSMKAPAKRAVMETLDADPFGLSSRPESKHTLYLDFNGETLTNKAFNKKYSLPDGYILTAYDTDDDPGTFSAQEGADIIDVWRRVSAAFATFDVNVTTKEPDKSALDRVDSKDDTYGLVVVITNDSSLPVVCNCSGLAYLNQMRTIGERRDFYSPPALVFAMVSHWYSSYIAKTTSHEIGHLFGLVHDGTSEVEYYRGQGAWGPIMGSSGQKPISHWSKGEYANANNFEDDISIIAQNIPMLPDDHAGELTSATPLMLGQPTSGAITGPDDTDVFMFTTFSGGEQVVSVQTTDTGTLLDTRLSIFDGSGQLVGTANPEVPVPPEKPDSTRGLDAVFTLPNTPAGSTYFAAVSGTGQGDPSDDGYTSYSSIGRYAITVTEIVPPPAPKPGIVSAPGKSSKILPAAFSPTTRLSTSPLIAMPLGKPYRIRFTNFPARSGVAVKVSVQVNESWKSFGSRTVSKTRVLVLPAMKIVSAGTYPIRMTWPSGQVRYLRATDVINLAGNKASG